MGYIYCITNLINSKRYIGKTTSNIDFKNIVEIPEKKDAIKDLYMMQ